MALRLKIPFSRKIREYVVGLQTSLYYQQSSGWVFSPLRSSMFRGEIENWLSAYRPIDLRGKVVLDVGGGEGESAMFFLKSGARRVVVVECDDACFANLKKNSEKFNIEPIYRKFDRLDLFRSDIDFAKIDIEGWEELILGSKPRVPCVVEVHGQQLRERFIAEGWRVTPCRLYDCVCYAYWGC